MTEYIIIVAVIAIGSIAVYSYFGDVLRNQTAAAAAALAGGSGAEQTGNAGTAAENAGKNVAKSLSDFAEGKGTGSGSGATPAP
ncbi:MAG: hypothetical protein LBB76_03265 [Azoarcus sp.]|jgi:Tfp pilus assembly protein PilE|nr:hypothetical protein [Azoarcus sp.]